MTKEDIKYLETYERNFITAINHNYTRNMVGSVLDTMLEIYERETGKKYKLCKSCTSSVIQFLKVIGKIYLDQKGNEPAVIVSELENTVTEKENKKKKNKK